MAVNSAILEGAQALFPDAVRQHAGYAQLLIENIKDSSVSSVVPSSSNASSTMLIVLELSSSSDTNRHEEALRQRMGVSGMARRFSGRTRAKGDC